MSTLALEAIDVSKRFGDVQALDGVDLTRLDVYVGVSSGAFLAAGLANGISTAEMCRIFITGDAGHVRRGHGRAVGQPVRGTVIAGLELTASSSDLTSRLVSSSTSR